MRTTLAIIPLLFATMGTASAETLSMPEGGDSMSQQQTISMSLPVKGMSMSKVEREFGAPHQKLRPVGEPTITRWVYEEYTVYFEGKYVIHSVLHP